LKKIFYNCCSMLFIPKIINLRSNNTNNTRLLLNSHKPRKNKKK